MWGLCDISARAVRRFTRSWDFPADKKLWHQGLKLHPRNTRLQDEIRGPREVPVRSAEKIRWVLLVSLWERALVVKTLEGELVSITMVSEALIVIRKQLPTYQPLQWTRLSLVLPLGSFFFFVSTKLMITKERLAKADIKIQFCQINTFYWSLPDFLGARRVI